MTTPVKLFQDGKLSEAIEAQTAEVRREPADPARRMFLFELLCFAGNFDRAALQIDAIRLDDMGQQAAITRYRRLLDSEQKRQRLFTAGEAPKFFIEPPEDVTNRLQALELYRGGKTNEAAQRLAAADESLPTLTGTLNGKAFEGLRDGDDFLAAVIEVFVQGDYYWAPLAQIEEMHTPAPKFPRDLLWLEADLVLRSGGHASVFLPLLYPGTSAHPNDQVKLGRMTQWDGPEEGPLRGVGLKTFLGGEEGCPLREWRSLSIDG